MCYCHGLCQAKGYQRNKIRSPSTCISWPKKSFTRIFTPNSFDNLSYDNELTDLICNSKKLLKFASQILRLVLKGPYSTVNFPGQ